MVKEGGGKGVVDRRGKKNGKALLNEQLEFNVPLLKLEIDCNRN